VNPIHKMSNETDKATSVEKHRKGYLISRREFASGLILSMCGIPACRRIQSSRMAPRVIVFGVDGIDPDLLDKWTSAGELPNFARLKRDGASGTVCSTCPPISAAAWTTAATGVNPGKHGIFGFVCGVRSLEDGKKEWSYYNSRDRRYPAVWSRLTQAGKRVAIINVPLTSPPEAINGMMISSIPFVNPQEFASPLSYQMRIAGRYPLMSGDRLDVAQTSETLQERIENEQKRFAVSMELLDSERWALFWHASLSVDGIQHFFWKFMDGRASDGPTDAILQGYRELDRQLGEILKRMDDRTTLLVFSDHGFGPLKKIISTDAILAEAEERFKDVVFFALEPEFGMFWVASPYGDRKGIDPAAGDKAVSWLCDKLRSLSDPETGKSAIAQILTKDEIAWGPCSDQTPDVFAWGAPGSYFKSGIDPAKGKVMKAASDLTHWSGQHRMNGVLLSLGRGIQPGAQPEEAWLADIAPTISHFLEETVPDDMDGRVISEIMKPEFLVGHPPPPAPQGRSHAPGCFRKPSCAEIEQ